jgi:hypothetical protein
LFNTVGLLKSFSETKKVFHPNHRMEDVWGKVGQVWSSAEPLRKPDQRAVEAHLEMPKPIQAFLWAENAKRIH